MIHLLSISGWGGYNISPTFTLPAAKKRILFFLGAGTSNSGTRNPVYNNTPMTVFKSIGAGYGAEGSATIAYLEIPDDWSGTYPVSGQMVTSYMMVCFGGAKRTDSYLAKHQINGTSVEATSVNVAVESRPSGLFVAVLHTLNRTNNVTNLKLLYKTSDICVGYATPSSASFTPDFTFTRGMVAYQSATFKPKPDYGSVTII